MWRVVARDTPTQRVLCVASGCAGFATNTVGTGQTAAVGLAVLAGALRMMTVRGVVMSFSSTPHRPAQHVAVTLTARRSGASLTVAAGRTDTLGRFALAAPILPKATYAVIAVYRGVPYSLAVGAHHAAGALTVPVYDTTSSDDGLAAMRVVIGTRRHGLNLAVIEQWLFTNASTRTDVGAGAPEGRGAAGFPLPAHALGARVLGAQSNVAAVVQRGRIVVDAVLRPATGLNAASFHQVTFTFDVSGGAGHPTLLIPTRYFIGSLQVFAVGARLFAPGFTQSSVNAGRVTMRKAEAQAVPPGSTLAVGIDGPPVGVAVPALATVPLPFPGGLVAVIAELGFGGLLLLGLLVRQNTPTAVPDKQWLSRERARLIDAIAEMDLEHERGEIPDDEYRRRRAGEKSRLLALSRQPGA